MRRYLTLLAVAGLWPSPAWAQSFFLSTEQIAAPGDRPTVKVEARDIPHLDVRLYRVGDPAAYFDAQLDLHRPKEDLLRPRASQVSALRRGLQLRLDALRRQLRSRFVVDAKTAMKSIAPDVIASANRGARPARVKKKVPLLKGHVLVDSWIQPLPPRDGWYYGKLEIPPCDAGVYVVEAVHGAQVAHTVVVVSEVALVTKQAADTLLVWAVDATTGEPKPGTRVTVKVRGETRSTKVTGGDGMARFALRDAPTPVIYAAFEDSFTLLDPRFFRANVDAPRVYVFTERPVYRAGQSVFIKGFARAMTDEQYSLPKQDAGTKVDVAIVDARGRAFVTTEAKLSNRGSFDTKFDLPADPTYGTWTAIVTLDGRRYAGEFKVLAFEKPEVLLKVRLDRPTVRARDKISGDVVGRYFYGTPYPEAPVKITVTRTRFYVPWYVDADYAWYYSEAEYRNTQRDVVAETECVLDAAGECPFTFTTADDADDYTYVVEAVSQDPNGRTVVGQAKATVTKGAFRLEIDQAAAVVEPGTPQRFTVRAVDYAGMPVETTVQVIVRARRAADDGVIEVVEALSASRRTDAAGEATFEFDPKQRGYYEIIAAAEDDAKTLLRQESFLFAASGSGDVATRPDDLALITDKRSYFSGETALVLVLSPQADTSVLFTVEGGGLYTAKVVKTTQHAVVVEVPIGDRQSPNFYLGATAVIAGQLYSRTRSVIVPPRDRILSVEVAPDRPKAEPGDDVQLTVSVTDVDGQPVPNAEVALGVVDEAIYAISPEIAVPLEAFFYPRKRNDVRLSDSLTFRFFGRARNTLGPQASMPLAHPYAFGALKPQDDDRDDDRDTAAWWPALTTDAEGKVSASFSLPDNLTTWRATARVISKSTRVGAGVGRIVSKKPVVVRVALPTSVNEGDEGRGHLSVQNLSGQNRTFSVSYEVEGPLEMKLDTPPAAPGPSRVDVQNGELVRIPISWRATAAGEVQVRARATAAGLNDQILRTFSVAPWTDVLQLSYSVDLYGDEATDSQVLRVPRSVDLSKAKLTLSLANSPIAAAQASLPGLIDFPHGCTEQTMSRFVPLLVAKAARNRWQLPVEEAVNIPTYVAAGIARLGQLQNDDGSWGWFTEGGDGWMTAWVVEGLAEAQKLGADVDADMLERGVEALRRQLSASAAPPDIRAFAAYALSKAGDPMSGMLRRLLDDDADGLLASSGLAYVVMAAKLAGEADILRIAQRRLTTKPHMIQGARGEAAWCLTTGKPPRVAERTPVECTALAVRALATVTATAAEVVAGTTFLMRRFDGVGFGSTRQTALAIRALAAAAPTALQANRVVATVDGVALPPITVDGSKIARVTPSLKLSNRNVRVELSQQGGSRTFVDVRLKGPERKTVFERRQRGLRIRRTYRSLKGSDDALRAGRPSRTFQEGDPVLVVLQVTAERPVEHVLIEAPHPAGLAPVLRDGSIKVAGVKRQPPGAFREHRPDRTVFFLRRLQGTVQMSYLTRATLPGQYRTLPARAESMYLPESIYGRSTSADIRITPRP